MSWELGQGKRRSIKSALYGEAASGAWSHGGPWRTVRVLPEKIRGARRLWLLSTDSSFLIGWGCLWGNQLPRTFNLPPRPQEDFWSQKKKSPQAESHRCPSTDAPASWNTGECQRGCGQVGPWEPLLLYFSTQRDHPSTNSSFSGQSASDDIKDKNTQVLLLKK